MKIQREKTKYLLTLHTPEQLATFFAEHSGPIVVLCGRSNVGKSTLINALLRNGIARTSKTPGKTRDINVYEFHFETSETPCLLFDLPGYGHANVSKTEKRRWDDFLNTLFTQYQERVKVWQIIDAKVGAQKSDMEFLQYICRLNLEPYVLLNKIDKLKNQKERAKLKKLKADFVRCTPISAEKKQGLDMLLEQLHQTYLA